MALMGIPDAVFIQMGGYIFVSVAILFLINRSSQGFLSNWFKVRRKRGALILVRVRTVINDYFIPGKVEEGWLTYTPRGKKKDEGKRIGIVEGSIYRAYGLHCIDIDDTKNCSFKRDSTAVPGYDAEKNNSLHLRALYKPSIMDDKTKIIIVILIIIALAVIIDIALGLNMSKTLGAKINSLSDVAQATASTIKPTTGGV
jgi:hypothetical protein